jgi:hypothetical protein
VVGLAIYKMARREFGRKERPMKRAMACSSQCVRPSKAMVVTPTWGWGPGDGSQLNHHPHPAPGSFSLRATYVPLVPHGKLL